MTLQVRRVVTGHNNEGKAIAWIDEISRDIVTFRKGANVVNLWSTEGFPVDNTRAEDGAKRIVGTTRSSGTVFRIIEFMPGVAPRNHRTASIDYALVLSGKIDMEMDGGAVQLRAGDVLVQRGTIHEWFNRYSEPCVIAFVLIDAEPVLPSEG